MKAKCVTQSVPLQSSDLQSGTSMRLATVEKTILVKDVVKMAYFQPTGKLGRGVRGAGIPKQECPLPLIPHKTEWTG